MGYRRLRRQHLFVEDLRKVHCKALKRLTIQKRIKLGSLHSFSRPDVPVADQRRVVKVALLAVNADWCTPALYMSSLGSTSVYCNAALLESILACPSSCPNQQQHLRNPVYFSPTSLIADFCSGDLESLVYNYLLRGSLYSTRNCSEKFYDNMAICGPAIARTVEVTQPLDTVVGHHLLNHWQRTCLFVLFSFVCRHVVRSCVYCPASSLRTGAAASSIRKSFNPPLCTTGRKIARK